MNYLSSKQMNAAALLAQGKLCREAAEAVKVRPGTISKWKQEYEFQALVNVLRAEALEAALACIQTLAAEAASTIGELLKAGSPHAVRLKAAEVVLAHAGLTDQQSGHWYWNVGPTSGDGVRRQKIRALKAAGLEAVFRNSTDERRV